MSKLLNIIYFLCISVLFLSSCSEDFHEGERGLVVSLDTSECPDATIENVSVTIYGTDGNLVWENIFVGAEELASTLIDIAPGNYTVRAVVSDNVQGQTDVYVEPTGITHTTVRLQQLAGSNPVRILMTLPDNTLPDYAAAKNSSRSQSEDAYVLRSVVELCRKGENAPLNKYSVNPEILSDGRLLVQFAAPHGEYDLRVWTDRARSGSPTSDYLYDTGSLNSVSIITGPYQAGASLRDAAYYCGTLNHGAELTESEIELVRPLAKYRLIADDVSRYNEFREKQPDKYPPLSELTVEVAYEYFFPSAFNVTSGRPVDSATGVYYNSGLEQAVGFSPDHAMMAAHDCVLTNGSDSFVYLTVTVFTPQGDEVARSSGIRVDYRRGCLTTVRGNFLTAGMASGGGGISIDTDWEDDIIIEF